MFGVVTVTVPPIVGDDMSAVDVGRESRGEGEEGRAVDVVRRGG